MSSFIAVLCRNQRRSRCLAPPQSGWRAYAAGGRGVAEQTEWHGGTGRLEYIHPLTEPDQALWTNTFPGPRQQKNRKGPGCLAKRISTGQSGFLLLYRSQNFSSDAEQ